MIESTRDKPKGKSLSLLFLMVTITAANAGDSYKSVCIQDVPHIKQKPDFCGEACIAMWLKKLGHKISQDNVFDHAKLDPALGRGCWTREMVVALKALGFASQNVSHKVSPPESAVEMKKLWKSLHADLVKGIPSIICMKTSLKNTATEHFRLILGYDSSTGEVIYHEPAADKGSYHRMTLKQLLELWPLRYQTHSWTVIRMPLVAGDIITPKATHGFTPADYCQQVMKIRKSLPPKDFTILVEPPFVVAGDESAAMVKRRAKKTIKWATDHLKAGYFKNDPKYVLTVYLFKDKESYLKYNLKLFNSHPETPYGYYSSAHRALVMNIGTGGGTLVHEIVHPFIGTNFPACPSWLNEGLGSLYEQCGERDGKLVGFTNWRLRGLQKAISRKIVPSFKTLCSTTTHEFYNKDKGTNYSQARYLCYYLQEKGLLRKYYHTFHKNAASDPSGYETLKRTLRVEDMAVFQKQWEKWVMTLTFP